ncbi:hypothetical protein ALC57_12843, partial [Trachymyrmex cornetzi]
IYMSKQHPTTAVSFQTYFEVRNKNKTLLPFGIFCLKESQICFPFISNDFSAGKAPHRNDHRDSS